MGRLLKNGHDLFGNAGEDDASVLSENVVNGVLECFGTVFGDVGDVGAIDDDSGWVSIEG